MKMTSEERRAMIASWNAGGDDAETTENKDN